MKLVLVLLGLIALYSAQTQGATMAATTTAAPASVETGDCESVLDCGTCVDPDLECVECDEGYILTEDKQGCESCPAGCCECERDDTNALVCTECCHQYVEKEDDDTCIACGDGCRRCSWVSADETVCDQCIITRYTLKRYDGVDHEDCLWCGPACLDCGADKDTHLPICKECEAEGHYLRTTGNNTVDCGDCPDNCMTCNEGSDGLPVCTQCDEGYSAVTVNGRSTCLWCPVICQTCDGQPTYIGDEVQGCTQCTDGYFVDINRICRACDADCKTCDGKNNDECLSCYPSQFLQNDGTCVVCDSNCIDCADASTCTTCATGYYEDGGSCASCPSYCDECESTADGLECLTCTAYRTEKPIGDITCEVCVDPNCVTCTSDALECTACATGYVLDSTDKDCEPCIEFCDSTQCAWDNVNSKVVCTASNCETGYQFRSDLGTCELCPEYCTTGCIWDTDHTECTNCDNDDGNYKGRIVSSDDLGCLDCNVGCDVCETDMNCTSCYNGYWLDGIVCQECSVSNCAECSNSTWCDVCDIGFDLDPAGQSSSCVACDDSNCDTCTLNNGDGSTPCDNNGCASGYVQDSGECYKCPSNCVGTCSLISGDTHCDSESDCAAEYTLVTNTDAEGQCRSCPSQCADCEWQTSGNEGSVWCTTCDSYYIDSPFDGTCTACTANCLTCDEPVNDGDLGLCQTNGCDVGYGYRSDGTCEACPDDCTECTFTEVGGSVTVECDTCDSNFRLNDDTVCVLCPEHCAECSYLSSDQSVRCDTCDEFYALDTNFDCIACPTYCNDCTGNGVGATDCLSGQCQTGYFVNSDRDCEACTSLFPNCLTCSDSTGSGATEKVTCHDCMTGYVKQDDDLACLPTAGDANCETYEDRLVACSASGCDAGFIYNDGHCDSTCYVCGNTGNQSKSNYNSCGKAVEDMEMELATEVCEDACWTVMITSGQVERFIRSCGKPTTALLTNVECNDADGDTVYDSGDDSVKPLCCRGDRCNSESGSTTITVTSSLIALLMATVWLLH